MASGLVSLRSRRWRAVSRAAELLERRGTVLLALIALLSLPASADPERSEGRSLLLFPVQSHWLSAPLAQKATAALDESLVGAGFAVTVYDPASPIFRPLPTDTPEMPALFALDARVQASVTAALSESNAEVALKVGFQGTVSRQSVNLEFRAPISENGNKERALADLARQVAAALTPEVWARAAADEEGRKKAAAARYADGQKAMQEPDGYLAASDEFEAAIFGDPSSPAYLVAAAEAQATQGNWDSALVKLRSAASLAPTDVSILLRQGDVALLAGRAEQAAGAFRVAQGIHPFDLQALEGLARSARALGRFDQAVGYYATLVAHLPGLGPEQAYLIPPPAPGVLPPTALPPSPPWESELKPATLPRLLAQAPDGTVRLAGTPEDELPRELGLLYLAAGEPAQGVRYLLSYHEKADRPAYTQGQYAIAAAGMDAEAEAVAREAPAVLSARDLNEASDDEAEETLDGLHTRSDNLATVGERVKPPDDLDAAHRYRALAYNLLNQSGFEALFYVRTGDPDRLRRAEFWRKAYREARAQALELEAATREGSGE